MNAITIDTLAATLDPEAVCDHIRRCGIPSAWIDAAYERHGADAANEQCVAVDGDLELWITGLEEDGELALDVRTFGGVQ